MTVPEGVTEGQQLQVQVPAAPTVVAAAAPPAAQIAPLRLTVDTRGPVAKEVESAQVRSLNNEKLSLTLQLATSAQATTGAQGREAELQLELEKMRGERDAYARQMQEGGIADTVAEGPPPSPGAREVSEDAALQTAEGESQLRTLQAQLREVQTKAAEAAQAAREERLKVERARMEAELGMTQLKEERLQLQEQILTAEEAALEAQQDLENEKQGVLELKEALMKADLRAEQLDQKLQLKDASETERVERLQAELAEAEERAREAQEEAGSLEEEKYGLVHDIEVLEEELEDANSHQKRYYEALMQKEEQLNRHKAQCATLTKAVEKLQYENELSELRNNPVGEELDVSHLHEEQEELKKLNASKDRELRRLKSELESMQLTVDDEESYDQQSPPKRKNWLENSNENVPTINVVEAPTPGGAEDDYGKQMRAREEMEAKQAAEAEAAKARAAAEARQLEESEQLTRLQLQQEKERAEQGAVRVKQLEAHAQQKEREVMALIAARDELVHQQSKKEEELSEMQDNLYDASQKLEEEQDRAAELQAEADKLREELQAAQKSQVAARSLEVELDDEREAHRKTQAKLAAALG